MLLGESHATIHKIKLKKSERGGCMAEKLEKRNLYLLAIVGIVAVVGIIVLILGRGSSSTLSTSDISGQAIASSVKPTVGSLYYCTDTDGGNKTTIYGELTYAGKTVGDSCSDETHVTEGMCNVRTYDGSTGKSTFHRVFYQEILCGSWRSPGTCVSGACI